MTGQPGDVILVLGGLHAGRHDFAIERARSFNRPILYLPTLPDHPALPGARTLDGTDPAGAVRAWRNPEICLLLGDLAPWLAVAPDGEGEALAAAVGETRGPLVLVSREAGLGIVPMGREERHARDALGRFNQRLAALAGRAFLVVAGLPLALKDGP